MQDTDFFPWFAPKPNPHILRLRSRITFCLKNAVVMDWKQAECHARNRLSSKCILEISQKSASIMKLFARSADIFTFDRGFVKNTRVLSPLSWAARVFFCKTPPHIRRRRRCCFVPCEEKIKAKPLSGGQFFKNDFPILEKI